MIQEKNERKGKETVEIGPVKVGSIYVIEMEESKGKIWKGLTQKDRTSIK